nr:MULTISPECIES: hypothetical protein [Vibrio]
MVTLLCGNLVVALAAP